METRKHAKATIETRSLIKVFFIADEILLMESISLASPLMGRQEEDFVVHNEADRKVMSNVRATNLTTRDTDTFCNQRQSFIAIFYPTNVTFSVAIDALCCFYHRKGYKVTRCGF